MLPSVFRLLRLSVPHCCLKRMAVEKASSSGKGADFDGHGAQD